MLFFQVFSDDTVFWKSKDPARSRGHGLLIVAPVLDFEGPVRPASRDGMDPSVIQSEADEQVFNITDCHKRVLYDRSAFLLWRVWSSEGAAMYLAIWSKWAQNSLKLYNTEPGLTLLSISGQ